MLDEITQNRGERKMDKSEFKPLMTWRGASSVSGEMIYGNFTEPSYITTSCGVMHWDVIPESLAIFTGLYDANGTPIFASVGEFRGGDVVRAIDSNKQVALGETGYVRWVDCGFRAVDVPPWDWDKMSPAFSLDSIRLTVIGNAYQSPELLDGRY